VNGGRTPEGHAYAYATALRAFDRRAALTGAADTRAGILLATDGVVAGLFFARGSVLATAPTWMTIVATASIVISAALSVIALMPRALPLGEDPRTVARLVEDNRRLDDSVLQWSLLPGLLAMLDRDDRRLRRKGLAVATGGGFLLVTLGLLAGYHAYTIVV
jgi:hypothetical protein